MKKDMPLEGLRWSRDSGSALYDTPQTAVLGRAGVGNKINKAYVLIQRSVRLVIISLPRKPPFPCFYTL